MKTSIKELEDKLRKFPQEVKEIEKIRKLENSVRSPINNKNSSKTEQRNGGDTSKKLTNSS